MFAYEKTTNQKWPWRVTEAGWILLPELRGLSFSFDPSQRVWFFFWTPGENPGTIQRVTICKGYTWDGCSGPVPTTKRSARASCVHDVLYQSMREGLLEQSYRAIADKIFYRLLLEDGMPRAIAWGYFMAVRIFGGPHAKRKK